MNGIPTLGWAVAFPLAAAVALGASLVLVARLERLSVRWRLSGVILGFLVALGADAPEIASAMSAAVHGRTDIGAGVVLGSNVFNLAALLGLSAAVAGRVALHRRVVVLEGVTALWVALVTVLVVTAVIGPALGLSLVTAVVVAYAALAVVSPDRLRRLGLPPRSAAWIERAVIEEEREIAEAVGPAPAGSFDTVAVAASLVVIVSASTVMERSAEHIGKQLGLSSLVIGGVVLAAVTSLPNAVGAVFLAARGRGSAVLSEAMNSNMLNVVAGFLLPGLFYALPRRSSGDLITVAFYAGLTLFALGAAYVERGVTRRTGWMTIAGYVAFVVLATTR